MRGGASLSHAVGHKGSENDMATYLLGGVESSERCVPEDLVGAS